MMLKLFAENRLLISIILPVLVIGAIIAYVLPALLSPRLFAIISSRNDALLVHAMDKAISSCEERFQDLLDLRMSANAEMRTASLNQVIEEIKAIHNADTDIHMVVLSTNAQVMGSTAALANRYADELLAIKWQTDGVLQVTLPTGTFFAAHRYFPFWKIHIYGMIPRDVYMAPIHLAKRIVYLGTFGVMLVVLVVLVLLFLFQVNRPLNTLVQATESVQTDNPRKIAIKRADEIGKLSLAFNAMVDNLVEDKYQLREIMRELRDSEEQYRILSEYSLTHIAMIQKHRLTFINRTMAQAVGLEGQEAYQNRFSKLVDPADRSMVEAHLGSLHNGESETAHFECRIPSADGATVWLDAIATLALYRETHAILFHAVDITKRKGLERKLSQAQKMEAIGTLAGGVAHDLNNILSGLLGYPDLLLLDLPPDSPLRHPLIQIQRSAERAADIVQDLLSMARQGVGVKEVLSLNTIIEDYFNSLEHKTITASHPQVAFDHAMDDYLLNVEGSCVHLTKCIMNLVRNAAESIQGAGAVTLQTVNRYVEQGHWGDSDLAEGDYVVLTVSDTGTGIPEADAMRIFEPFYTKKTLGHSGTGLGMSVVLGTVQDHNGKIDVTSQEGHGTCFTLFFPATRQLPKQSQLAIPIERYTGNGETILVVDDVEDQRRLMADLLGRFGYSVNAVDSGEAAVAYLMDHSCDLILLDMLMDPGMDGLETLEKILTIVPDQKSIILSGYSEPERVNAALRLGAGAYLKKPIVMEKLGMAVREELFGRSGVSAPQPAAREIDIP